jgi:hypothetical protein
LMEKSTFLKIPTYSIHLPKVALEDNYPKKLMDLWWEFLRVYFASMLPSYLEYYYEQVNYFWSFLLNMMKNKKNFLSYLNKFRLKRSFDNSNFRHIERDSSLDHVVNQDCARVHGRSSLIFWILNQ